MMTTVQKWLMGLIALGAGYLVFTNPQGFASAATGVEKVVGGSEIGIITGGKRGG
jgi:hypothetical protein